jgi:hypothetical protein
MWLNAGKSVSHCLRVRLRMDVSRVAVKMGGTYGSKEENQIFGGTDFEV